MAVLKNPKFYAVFNKVQFTFVTSSQEDIKIKKNTFSTLILDAFANPNSVVRYYSY
jgi:hypothetical protein